MKPTPGTYALIIKSSFKTRIQIGRWRQIDIEPGYYIYVGSALGLAGFYLVYQGIFKKKKNKHWHIDYLRNFVSPFSVWCSYDSNHLEHQWALALGNMKGISSIQGFGCSDCNCYSHLFWSISVPDYASFANKVGGDIESFSYHHH